jgi:hypothetical protein
MRLVVISAKKRSTRLSQDALFGVKCRWKRRRLASHAFTSGRLVGPVAVEHQVNVEVLLHAPVDPLQEANKLVGTVARLTLADDDAALANVPMWTGMTSTPTDGAMA